MTADEAKRRAAEAALAFVPQEGIIGLGTGSTVHWFILGLGELVRKGRRLSGVPTSIESRNLAQNAGIPLLSDEGPWSIDLCVDGADEVSAELDLIKGGGGAHTREKIVNFAAAHNIIVVDESKLSAKLGEKRGVPVEVLEFGHATTARALGGFGRIELRERQGRPWRTDSGHFLYDVYTGPIAQPEALDRELHSVPGVVETGLFCRRADLVLAASAAGVRQVQR